MVKRTVLIVDDEPDLLTILSKGVAAAGYPVLTANNGKECIDVALKQCPDLILLDIDMPEFDGTETLSILKSTEATKDIPVIMLTAYTEEDYIMESILSGATGYLVKPYNHVYLIKRIKRTLEVAYGADEIVLPDTTRSITG